MKGALMSKPDRHRTMMGRHRRSNRSFGSAGNVARNRHGRTKLQAPHRRLPDQVLSLVLGQRTDLRLAPGCMPVRKNSARSFTLKLHRRSTTAMLQRSVSLSK